MSQFIVSSRLQQVNIEGEKPPPSLTHLSFCMLEIYSNMKTFKHIARVNMVYNMILHRIDSVSMVYMLYNPFGLLIIKLKNKLQSDYKININDNWIIHTNKYNKKITNIVIPVQWFITADFWWTSLSISLWYILVILFAYQDNYPSYQIWHWYQVWIFIQADKKEGICIIPPWYPCLYNLLYWYWFVSVINSVIS